MEFGMWLCRCRKVKNFLFINFSTEKQLRVCPIVHISINQSIGDLLHLYSSKMYTENVF